MAFKASLQVALFAAAAAAAAVPASFGHLNKTSSSVNTTTVNGQTYVYESLAGYGFTPSNSRDKYGDTAGGLGSSEGFELGPGLDTQGTVNYQSRIHKFGLTFTPNASATVSDPSPPNIQPGLLNEKWESLALVPVEPDCHGSDGEYYLFSISDNDFITQDGYANFGKYQYADDSGYNVSNQVLVFKVQLPLGSRPRVG